MRWEGIFNMTRKVLSDNKATVLFTGGVVCLGACTVLTAKAAPKVKENTEALVADIHHRGETGAPMEAGEKAKRVMTDLVIPYIPAGVAGIASVAAFALSNRNLAKEAAGAAAACAVAEKALGAYQDSVLKELGEEVNDKILKQVVDDVPDEVMEKSRGYLTDNDVANLFDREINDKLYYDHITGRMFWSSDEKIKDAESTVNKLLIDVGFATVNDFYSALLLDCDSVIGDAIGWRVEDPHARNMDIIFGSRLDRENNLPLITIGYRTCAVNLRELERR